MRSQQPTADDIRREMDSIRADMHVDMDGLVTNARHLTDWKHYVRSFPWASLGVATAIGYFAVPRRLEIQSPDAETLEKLARENRLVVQHSPQGEEKRGLLVSLANLLGNMAVRAGVAYVGQQTGRMFGEQAAQTAPQQSIAET